VGVPVTFAQVLRKELLVARHLVPHAEVVGVVGARLVVDLAALE